MVEEVQLNDNAKWKQRFRVAGFYSAQIAQLKTEQGIIASNLSGTLQWYRWDVPSNDLHQITNTEGGHPSNLMLSPDGHWVYYLEDHKGDEVGHYMRMPVTGGDAEFVTAGILPFSPFGCSISRCGSHFSFVASYEDRFELYCVDIARNSEIGNLRKLHSSKQVMSGAQLSSDGALVFIETAEKTGNLDYALQVFEVSTGKMVSELWDGEGNALEIMMVSPVPGDPRLLATTNESGTETLFLWNPLTGERSDLSVENISGSIRAYNWSPNGNQILFRTIHSAIQQLYLHNLNTGETTQLHYPDGTCFGCSCFAAEGNEILILWTDASHALSLIALSTISNEMTRTVFSAQGVPPGHKWKSVKFPSSDGEIIQGWLATPDGKGPFPTIIETHGGPAAVQTNTFHPEGQAWVDHGFAFLTINYRGSITFGSCFEQKIWGNPGHWEGEDVVASRTWLVEQKITKPDAVFLTGLSYGGYLTLLCVGKYPDLWAGGMAEIAISDWVVSYEDSAGALRGYQVALFGGTPDEKAKQYAISSPITYTKQIKSPVQIIQGKQDTRTPARAIIEYEARMIEFGKKIEVHWFEAGHLASFSSIDLAIQNQELKLNFAFRVLGDKKGS